MLFELRFVELIEVIHALPQFALVGGVGLVLLPTGADARTSGSSPVCPRKVRTGVLGNAPSRSSARGCRQARPADKWVSVAAQAKLRRSFAIRGAVLEVRDSRGATLARIDPAVAGLYPKRNTGKWVRQPEPIRENKFLLTCVYELFLLSYGLTGHREIQLENELTTLYCIVLWLRYNI
jgi:hypothetical protein